MEICILKFDGSRAAEEALDEVIDAQAARNPWLHDVGAIARPLVGRVRVRATFPDGKAQKLYEGDLADAIAELGGLTGYFVSSLAGPFGQMIGSVNAALAAGSGGSDLESRIFHIDEIKKALPRDSSALILIGQPELCDQFVELFNSYSPKVIRRDVADELRQRLESLHHRVAEKVAQAAAEGAPATH